MDSQPPISVIPNFIKEHFSLSTHPGANSMGGGGGVKEGVLIIGQCPRPLLLLPLPCHSTKGASTTHSSTLCPSTATLIPSWSGGENPGVGGFSLLLFLCTVSPPFVATMGMATRFDYAYAGLKLQKTAFILCVSKTMLYLSNMPAFH